MAKQIIGLSGENIYSNHSFQGPKQRTKKNLIMKDWTNQLPKPKDNSYAENNKSRRERINKNYTEYKTKQNGYADDLREGQRIETERYTADEKIVSDKLNNQTNRRTDPNYKTSTEKSINRNRNKQNSKGAQTRLNNEWNAAQDSHNVNSDYRSDNNRTPLGADDIRMGRGNYSNAPLGSDRRSLNSSPVGDLNSTTRGRGMKLAKEMGFNKAELDMVGGMFDANKGYNTAKTGYHAARGASKEATSQYNALKSSIDANRESMTNLTGSAQSKVGKQVSMQEKQLEKMLGTKNSAAGALEQATEYKRAAARNVLGGRSSTNEYINGMASKDAAGVVKNATKDKFAKLGSELAEGKGMNKITKNLKGAGKVGAYAVGALALVGMVQAMNDSKGQQSNSQMYNPGGS